MKRFLITSCLLLLLIGTVSADVFYPQVDAMLGNTSNYTYSQMRSATRADSFDGTAASTYLRTTAHATATDKYAIFRRMIFNFNTSSIPDNAVITGANFSVKCADTAVYTLGDPELSVTGGNPASNTSLTNNDFDNFLNTRLAPGKLYSTVKWNVRQNFTLNSDGLEYISKTAYTNFYLRESWDVNNSFGGTWSAGKTANVGIYFSESSGTDDDPFLDVTYIIPDTTPPDSINTLTTTEITCNSINWSWANPPDADYDGVMMYINNVFSHNASKYATWGLTQSLQENKDYTLSTHTFDASGNVNSTWVNLTVTTESCEEPIPEAILSVSFVANVTCGVVPFNVLFTDTSSGANITGWNWTFGDGNTSVLEDGNNTYSNVGMYTVNHSVTNSTSGIAWNNKTDYIRAIPGWATCAAFEGTGGTGGYAYQLQQAPIEPAIAIIAVIATLFIISRRRE